MNIRYKVNILGIAFFLAILVFNLITKHFPAGTNRTCFYLTAALALNFYFIYNSLKRKEKLELKDKLNA